MPVRRSGDPLRSWRASEYRSPAANARQLWLISAGETGRVGGSVVSARSKTSGDVSCRWDPPVEPPVAAAPRTDTRRWRKRWRMALLGSVAAGAILIAAPRAVRAGPDACTVPVAGTALCQGDQSAGIVSGTDFAVPATTTLTVNSLTGDITPASGTAGIYFYSTGDITIDSDPTPFRIITQGPTAPGIYAYTGSGAVSVTQTGDVATQGFLADGISAVSLNGDVAVTQTGNIDTQGDTARGIYTRGFYAVTVTQTGDITTQGNTARGISAASFGGDVAVTQTGDISTQGVQAYGIRGFSTGGGAVTVTQTGNIDTQGNGGIGILGFAQTGGAATVTQTGDITTQGQNAHGISAFAFGDDVTVTQTGDISTGGNGAAGVLAQTSGAGTMTVTQTGDITTRGDIAVGFYVFHSGTGAVTVTRTGAILTSGASADGLFVESDGGTVTVMQTGDITVTGNGANAIVVDNAAGDGNATVTVAAGSTITGGSGAGDGVRFRDGTTNRLINYGTITTRGENAVEGTGNGHETVDNYGTITGNVDLGGGTNAFNNRSGGQFNAGGTVNLDAGNLLTNAGAFSPGGGDTIRVTTLTGNLTQTGTGSLATDIRFGSLTADRTNVSGTASLSGQVTVNVLNGGAAAPGTQQVTILTATGGVTDAGLTVRDTATVDYELLFPDANTVALGVSVDYAPGGLNRNQAALGAHVNAIQAAGGSAAFAPLAAALLGVPDLQNLANAYDQLGPEGYLGTQFAALFASLDFSASLMSCEVREGTHVFIREGQCVWARGQARFLDRDRTGQEIGFEEDAWSFSSGAQFALTPALHAGVAIGYEHSDLDTGTGVDSDGDRLQGGASVKWTPGPLLVAGALSGGNGWHDTTRTVAFQGFAARATSDHDVTHGAGQVRVGYLFGEEATWYVQPMVDFNATYLDLEDVREGGAGGANLRMAGDDDWVLSVSPAVEFGGQVAVGGGLLIRPFARAGLTAFDDTEFDVASVFQGAPAGVAPFTTEVDNDDLFADVAAGVDLLIADGTVVRPYYTGRLADDTDIHAAGVKASFVF